MPEKHFPYSIYCNQSASSLALGLRELEIRVTEHYDRRATGDRQKGLTLGPLWHQDYLPDHKYDSNKPKCTNGNLLVLLLGQIGLLLGLRFPRCTAVQPGLPCEKRPSKRGLISLNLGPL